MPHRKTVLIAEDNDDIRETLENALTLGGYNVQTARNGREALRRLKGRAEPTLVLLDLMMPIMNGLEFLRAQNADPELLQHPVVVLSAMELVSNEMTQSTRAVLTKPISLKLLLDTVDRFCENIRAVA